MSERTLSLLADYRARHPEEETTVDRFRELIATTPDCYERSGRPGHITGSAWLVSEDGGEVLLTHHRKLDRWLQFGGHSVGEVDPLSVATREAIEESGLQVRPLSRALLDIDIHPIPARPDDTGHLHYDLRFAFISSSGRRYTVSDESHDLAWVPIDRIDDYSDEPSLLRMARKWRTWQAAGVPAPA